VEKVLRSCALTGLAASARSELTSCGGGARADGKADGGSHARRTLVFLQRKNPHSQEVARGANCCIGERGLHPLKLRGQESTECVSPLLAPETRGSESGLAVGSQFGGQLHD
jgi:hypothetical protein